MAACCIQDFMLLFLLGFTPYSDTLNCYKGTMMKFGNDFSKTPIEWTSVETVSNLNEVLCQETLLIVDVGAKSLIVGSKGFARPGSKKTKHRKVHSGGPGIVAASYVNFCETDLCNAANTSQVLIGGFHISESTDLRNTQCSVCLHFKGSCTQNSNFVFCPEHTDCYASVIEIKRGGIKNNFSINGCLVSSSKYLFRNQYLVGIFSIVEKLQRPKNYSSSHLLVPGTSLAWVLGLGLFLALVLEGCVLSEEPIP